MHYLIIMIINPYEWETIVHQLLVRRFDGIAVALQLQLRFGLVHQRKFCSTVHQQAGTADKVASQGTLRGAIMSLPHKTMGSVGVLTRIRGEFAHKRRWISKPMLVG